MLEHNNRKGHHHVESSAEQSMAMVMPYVANRKHSALSMPSIFFLVRLSSTTCFPLGTTIIHSHNPKLALLCSQLQEL